MSTPAVTFSYDTFVGSFPQFSALSPGIATGFFNRACLIFLNTTGNPAFPDGNMEMLLYLLTAHIAWLNAPRDSAGNPASNGQNPPGLVGRINSASEGSVSVGVAWDGSGSPSEAWYIQTPFGAEFWAATAQYRTFRYSARPTVVAGGAGFPYGYGRRW